MLCTWSSGSDRRERALQQRLDQADVDGVVDLRHACEVADEGEVKLGDGVVSGTGRPRLLVLVDRQRAPSDSPLVLRRGRRATTFALTNLGDAVHGRVVLVVARRVQVLERRLQRGQRPRRDLGPVLLNLDQLEKGDRWQHPGHGPQLALDLTVRAQHAFEDRAHRSRHAQSRDAAAAEQDRTQADVQLSLDRRPAAGLAVVDDGHEASQSGAGGAAHDRRRRHLVGWSEAHARTPPADAGRDREAAPGPHPATRDRGAGTDAG